MDINELLTLVGRRWKLIIGCVVLALLGATALSVLVTPQYQSSARLFLTAERNAPRDPYSLNLLAGLRVRSYAELATSEPVLRAVAKRPDIKADVAQLREQIDATAVPDTVIIELVATDDSAKDAQKLARAASVEVSKYLSQLEETGKSASGLEVRVSDPATLPAAPTSPRTLLNLMVAGLLGLLVGLALAVLADRRARAEDEDDEPTDEADPDEGDDDAEKDEHDAGHEHEPEDEHDASSDRAVPAASV